MTTIGFECELEGAGHGAYVRPLINAGLWTRPTGNIPEQGHYNHCYCDSCKWGASKVRPMIDSTVSAELVSDPLPWPDPDSEAILTQLEAIIAEVGGRAGPRAGFHIHVAHNDPATDTHRPYIQRVIDYFTWYEPQLAVYARQTSPFVRPYNSWLSAPDALANTRRDPERMLALSQFRKINTCQKGQNLAVCPETMEFRIWNSTVDAWRMHFAIDMSVAFMRACEDAADIPTESDLPKRRPPLLDFVADYMTDTGYAYAVRHLATLET